LKQLTVLSGKGGTGKTTITASLAILANNPVIADCDVDAPDLHMLLHPEIIETQEFKGSKLAEIDQNKCIECGLCQKACRFEAITDFKIDAMRCEGCGTCLIVCPESAIYLKERVSGQAFISKTKYGMMSHALLFPGEANSGKLVTLVRHNARQIAEKEKSSLILIDGPPGLGCPVIASVSNYFNVLSLICINKHDINKENTQKIEKFCEKQKIGVVGKISFDPIVTEAMVSEKPVVNYSPENVVSREIKELWESIRRLM